MQKYQRSQSAAATLETETRLRIEWNPRSALLISRAHAIRSKIKHALLPDFLFDLIGVQVNAQQRCG